jgi:hypothetical protein
MNTPRRRLKLSMAWLYTCACLRAIVALLAGALDSATKSESAPAGPSFYPQGMPLWPQSAAHPFTAGVR